MDPSCYKDTEVSRGLNYHYYLLPPTDGKPTLLFLHGFPSSSYDWNRQIAYLQPKGYGIVAPDMLGLGRTSRPLDAEAFRPNLMAKDIIDLLDQENIDKVIGVAHDWGCITLCRLSILYPSRFIAFGWLGLSFREPTRTTFDLEKVMAFLKQTFGSETLAYWQFFNREDAPAIIEKNIDSFIQLLYPKDPECWNPYMVAPGKTAQWLENNMTPGFADYLNEEDINVIRRSILDGGIRSGLNYYKAVIQDVDLEDALNLPNNCVIEQPCFFAAAHKDYVCTPAQSKPLMEKYAKDLTTVDLSTGHWLQFEAADQLNNELEAWLQKKVNGSYV